MLDECDYDKRLGANEKTDFGYKATEVPLESSESSSEFEVHERYIFHIVGITQLKFSEL